MLFRLDDPALLWAAIAILLLPATYYLLLLHSRKNTIKSLQKRLDDVFLSKRIVKEMRTLQRHTHQNHHHQQCKQNKHYNSIKSGDYNKNNSTNNSSKSKTNHKHQQKQQQKHKVLTATTTTERETRRANITTKQKQLKQTRKKNNNNNDNKSNSNMSSAAAAAVTSIGAFKPANK